MQPAIEDAAPHLLCGSSNVVVEVIVAASEPRVPDFTVMLLPEVYAVTKPVKSSIESTNPLGRFVRGVVSAFSTLACVQYTVMPLAEVITLFKFTSKPIHCV